MSTDQLKGFIDRIERLEKEKVALLSDIREIYVTAKMEGYEPKIMRQLIKIRRKHPEELAEEEMLIKAYKKDIGMISGF